MQAGTYVIVSIDYSGADHWDRHMLQQHGTQGIYSGDRIKAGSERAGIVWLAAERGVGIVLEPVGKVWDRPSDAEPLAPVTAEQVEQAIDTAHGHSANRWQNTAGIDRMTVAQAIVHLGRAVRAERGTSWGGHGAAAQSDDRVATCLRAGEILLRAMVAGIRAEIVLAQCPVCGEDVREMQARTYVGGKVAHVACMQAAPTTGADVAQAIEARQAASTYVTEQVAASHSTRAANVLQVLLDTGAACTATASYYGHVTVWAGDDAAMVAEALTDAGLQHDAHIVPCHVGCSAHCTCDAEPGTDAPNLSGAVAMAIDCNGDRAATLDALATVPGLRGFDALGFYRGACLPSIIVQADALQVAQAHTAMRAAGTGYGCGAVLAPLDGDDHDTALATMSLDVNGYPVATLQGHRIGTSRATA